MSEKSPTGGETHFLTPCDESADCDTALSCLCGVCTRPCGEASDCGAWPNASCSPVVNPSTCPEPSATRVCEVVCAADADCSTLSAAHRCVNGACRAGSEGAPNPSVCEQDDMSGNELLVMGDSLFGATHQITAYLEDLARGAGALAVGERYRDYSAVTANTLAFGGRGIANQYAAAVAEAPVKVVIMDGGGADLLLGSCATLTPDCPLIADAVAAAGDLIAAMGDGGVQQIVYVFYPDYEDPALRAEMDVLRPLLADTCAASSAPCHWVDLRPAFEGHVAEYMDASGVLPNAAGAEASAGAIWAVMQEHCVAQ